MRTSRPGQSVLLLRDVVAILQGEGLDYAVIGAFALSVHGTVRASIDADARRGAQNLLDARSAYQGAQGPVDLDLLRAITRRFGRDAADRLEQVLAG